MSRLWLSNLPRSEKGMVSYASISSDLWKNIASILLHGAYMDAASSDLNSEFTQAVQRQGKKRSDSPPPEGLGESKEKMRELYNLRIAKAVDSLEKSPKPPPLFLPIAFLEKKCDPDFADELDIHERIAYQVFHGWDCYPLEVRCHMIEHACMRREYPENMRSYLLALARFDKDSLFLLLLRFRGRHMRTDPEIRDHDAAIHAEAKALEDCTGSLTHKRMGSEGASIYFRRGCRCLGSYYLMRLYAEVGSVDLTCDYDEATAKMLDTVLDAPLFAAMLVTMFYAVWEAMMTMDMEPLVGPFPPTKVTFELTPMDHALFRQQPPSAGLTAQAVTPLISCSHAGLCDAVRRVYTFNRGYALPDPTPGKRPDYKKIQGKVSITTRLDENGFIMMASEDLVMNERLDILHRLGSMICSSSAMTKYAKPLLEQSLRLHYPESLGIAGGVRSMLQWVGFEFLFRRNVDIIPHLADFQQPEPILLTMAFGTITTPDPLWAVHEQRALDFLAQCEQLTEIMRQRLISELEACPVLKKTEGKKHKKQHQPSDRALAQVKHDETPKEIAQQKPVALGSCEAIVKRSFKDVLEGTNKKDPEKKVEEEDAEDSMACERACLLLLQAVSSWQVFGFSKEEVSI